MTMAAGPVSLEHRTRGAPTYEEADSDVDAEGEEDLEINGGDAPLTKRIPTNIEVEDSDSDAEIDAEGDDDEEDELSADILRPSARRSGVEKDEDVDMEDEEEAEESSAAEGGEDSEEDDSDADSDDVADYDAVSEAAETAASAEVQTRNNCVSVAQNSGCYFHADKNPRFCQQDEEHDPSEEFEEYMACAVCGDNGKSKAMSGYQQVLVPEYP